MLKDRQGDPVEDFKITPEAKTTLKRIRQVQNQMRNYLAAKTLIQEQMRETEAELASMGQLLLDTLPKRKTNQLQGMNFAREEGPEDVY